MTISTWLVGIKLQISIIILFQISLKISSLCSILFFYAYDSISILHLQVNVQNTAYKNFPYTPQHRYQCLDHLLLPDHSSYSTFTAFSSVPENKVDKTDD